MGYSIMSGIRIYNSRTGRTTEAKDGADAALMTKIELDRRSGIAAQTPAQLAAAMRESSRRFREAIGS